MLSEEESLDRLDEIDEDKDGFVSWNEYLKEFFDIDSASEIDNYLSNKDAEEQKVWIFLC